MMGNWFEIMPVWVADGFEMRRFNAGFVISGILIVIAHLRKDLMDTS